MATFDIKTRDFGEVRFVCPDNGGYVRIWGADLGSLEGKQPCDGGSFGGSTLTASAASLERVARSWWKQFLRSQRAYS